MAAKFKITGVLRSTSSIRADVIFSQYMAPSTCTDTIKYVAKLLNDRKIAKEIVLLSKNKFRVTVES